MKIILTFLLFSLHCFIFAQPGSKAQDPSAEPYLKSLAGLFNPEKAVEIEFRYEVVSEKDNSTTGDYGSVIFKGPRYKLTLEDGEMYYNGQKLWVYNKSAEEVYLSAPGKANTSQMFIDPFRLLSDYKKNFKYRLKDEAKVNGRKYAHVELYPNEPGSNYSILRLYIDKLTSELYSLEYQQKNGVIYKVYLNEIIKDIKVSDSAFSWDAGAHPGVLEVEM